MIEIYITLALLAASLIAIFYFHYISSDKKISFKLLKFSSLAAIRKFKLGLVLVLQRTFEGSKFFIQKVMIKLPLMLNKVKNFFSGVKLIKVYISKMKLPKISLPTIRLPKITLPKLNLSFPKPKRRETSDFLKRLLDFKEKSSLEVSSGETEGKLSELKTEKKASKEPEEMSEESFRQVEKQWIEAIIKDSKDIVAYKKLAKLYYLHKDYSYCQEILDTLRKMGSKDPFIDKYQKKLATKLKS